MNSWMTAASQTRPTEREEFERSLVEMARSEKTAGDLTEALDGLMETTKAKTPHLDRLVAQTKLARQMGRELAVKEAGIANQALSAVKPLAGKALGWMAQNPTKAMGIGGAAVGALGGAAAGGPGNRLGGALGGAALGGAAGFGASKLPGGMGQKLTQGVANMGAKGWSAMGQPKLASILSTGLGRAGIGAAVGGAVGALHRSGAEQQGLAAGHHMRNALMGAAGGAALGGAAGKVAPMLGKAAPAAENALAHAPKPGAGMGHNPFSMPAPAAHSATDLAQMNRVKAVANSPVADQARKARAAHAMDLHRAANPEQYGMRAPSPTANNATSAGVRSKRPVSAPVTGFDPTMAKMAQRGGREFIKMAFSMSAQAEPGTPGGAQEPEAESQFQARPQRSSKPAVELYDALKHLSPKSMRGLQVAQPGT